MLVGEIGKKIMIKLPVFKEKEYIYITILCQFK